MDVYVFLEVSSHLFLNYNTKWNFNRFLDQLNKKFRYKARVIATIFNNGENIMVVNDNSLSCRLGSRII